MASPDRPWRACLDWRRNGRRLYPCVLTQGVLSEVFGVWLRIERGVSTATAMEWATAIHRSKRSAVRRVPKGEDFDEGRANGGAAGQLPHLHGWSTAMGYLCEVASIAGFVQQVAVSHLTHGYVFYSAGVVPDGKDPRLVDEKLVERYGLEISKWTRARRKREGIASVSYLRHLRFFVLLATLSRHPSFEGEAKSFRDSAGSLASTNARATTRRGKC